MKDNHYQRSAAGAGGGTGNVPFYEFVSPNLYAGDIVATLISASVKTIGSGVAAIRRWHWERTTRTALHALDDRILADIGVHRSQIDSIAETAARNPSYTPSRRS